MFDLGGNMEIGWFFILRLQDMTVRDYEKLLHALLYGSLQERFLQRRSPNSRKVRENQTNGATS